MRKLIWLFMLSPLFTFSQEGLNLILFGGFANYTGDLQNKAFTLDQSRGAFGAGLTYGLDAHFSIKGTLNYGRVAAHDKYNKASLKARNLSFASQIFEASLVGEYNIFDLSDTRITPYIFGGIAMFRFNPYTFDTTGTKIYLKGMGTEGQGMSDYPDRKPYNLKQFAIPFGGGIKIRINENTVLGYEFGFRKLFTDYLDDVSKTYVDPAKLAIYRTPEAVEISYRGDELKNGSQTYPTIGASRGGPKYKDWYYFSGITLTMSLFNREGQFLKRESGKGSTACPRSL